MSRYLLRVYCLGWYHRTRTYGYHCKWFFTLWLLSILSGYSEYPYTLSSVCVYLPPYQPKQCTRSYYLGDDGLVTTHGQPGYGNPCLFYSHLPYHILKLVERPQLLKWARSFHRAEETWRTDLWIPHVRTISITIICNQIF